MLILGIVIFVIGMLIVLFGKQFFFLRAFFGDRSMFAQIFWGALICIIGLVILYFSGAFN